jgi:polysaccharide biosynthesis/export protein
MRSCVNGLRLLVVLVAGLVLATCAQDSHNAMTPVASNTVAPAAALGIEAHETSLDYVVGPRDVLQVTVFQVPDLTRTVQVSGTGFVNLPLIGNVQVGGKTIDQAQQEIAAKLGKTYLRSPQVTLALTKSGQRVTVNGAVRTPQVMTLDNRLTLSQAIAAAGGLSEIGNAQRVHIARANNQSVNDQIFDLEAIQAGKAADPSLVNGDIVVVEESGSKVALKTLKDLVPFAVLGTLASDIRLKRDIVLVAQLPNGLRLYRYRYVWSPTLYVGVIAQEVRDVVPSAVTRGSDGYLRVNYRRLGLRLQTWDAWAASNRSDYQRSVTKTGVNLTAHALNAP